MEIMKVFSSYDDYGYEEEKLYSVLITEEELSIFSELQKEFNSKAQKALRSSYELKKGLNLLKSKGKPQYISKNFRTVMDPMYKNESLKRLARDQDKSHIIRNNVISKYIKDSPLHERITNRGLLSQGRNTRVKYTRTGGSSIIDTNSVKGHARINDGAGLRLQLDKSGHWADYMSL